mmetsp:Transcript_52082/g.106206  ORF Transcript_52082/g.106206 Transcript_52082/m.106206 type:complete len:212 (-) Transcript_52082:789-1424(-)
MRIASKIARQRVCRVKLIASSSGVMSLYFSLRIGSKRWQTSCGPGAAEGPRSLKTCTVVLNMKCLHCAHQDSLLSNSPSKQLIAVGLKNTLPSSAYIVFVTRSGIEARRLLPIFLSFRKPETSFRSLYSSTQYLRNRSIELKLCSVKSWTSSSNILSVRTSPTVVSLSPGLSMKSCTRSIISLYAGSLCVTQYSNGLLLTAAMFQVAASME